MASEEEKMQGILETVDQQEMVGICGRNDEFLRLIRGAFDCTIVARGNQITMSGRAEEVAQLEQLLRTGGFYDLPDLLIRTANENGGPDNITALLLCVEEVR